MGTCGGLRADCSNDCDCCDEFLCDWTDNLLFYDTCCLDVNYACSGTSDCCGEMYCRNGVCCIGPNDSEDECLTNCDCCGNAVCNKNGTCSPCNSHGIVCVADSDCCSGLVCLPIPGSPISITFCLPSSL